MSAAGEIDELVVGLAEPARRADVAARLAARLGVRQVLLLVRDSQLDVLLPAAGMPQTIAGGPLWRQLLRDCRHPGRHRARIDLPRGTERDALAFVSLGAVVLLVDGEPSEADCVRLEALLPLLAALLVSESRAVDAKADAAAALASAQRATSLAEALEAARAEASRLNARLREEQARKDDFLAMLAHELRNPLAPITHSVEILRNAQVAEPIRMRQLDVVDRQARQLSRLVEDLLDVSRVSRGRIELRRERIDLREVLEAAVDTTRPLLESRHHCVSIRLPEEPLPVHGDSDRLTQVFSNLLHNAAKYTERGGEIRLDAAVEGDAVTVSVSDTGIGIDPDMLGSVFDLFVQAPVALDRAQGGLGIGLTLVRSLVEMHEGTVDAQSQGNGRGSTFTVRLPRAPAQVDTPGSAAAGSTDPGRRRLRVLVVDDNRDAAQSLADLLRLGEHEVQLAYQARDALRIADAAAPDLVLLDIGLPEMDGLEVARRLRSRLGNGVRLVAVTGYGSEADRRRSFEAGFDEHRVKPVSVEDLEGIVAAALGPAAAPCGDR